ncbi:hypothetical protein [Leptolyngbya sp. FACHB-16]|nr:hypothetical protein [Leptolyngbya sp. FACHB-16]
MLQVAQLFLGSCTNYVCKERYELRQLRQNIDGLPDEGDNSN